MKVKFITCICANMYEKHLTRGKKYEVIDRNMEKSLIRVIEDNKKMRWFPEDIFELNGSDIPVLLSWRYDDYVDENDDGEDWNWIEISFKLSDGTRRWSILYTPERLLRNLKRPNIDPPGLHIPHLIIVRSYKKEDVDKILKYLDDNNELIEASLPLDSEE